MLNFFLGPRLAKFICVHIHTYVCISTYVDKHTHMFIPKSQAMQVDSHCNPSPVGFKPTVLGAWPPSLLDSD